MPLNNLSQYWTHGSYANDRAHQIRAAENVFLHPGGTGSLDLVDGNLTVGFRWDLDVQNLANTLSAFQEANIELTAREEEILVAYKNGGSAEFNVNGEIVTKILARSADVSASGCGLSASPFESLRHH